MVGRYFCLLLHAYSQLALEISVEYHEYIDMGLYEGLIAIVEQTAFEARGPSLVHFDITFVPSHSIAVEMCSCLLIRQDYYLLGFFFFILVHSKI